MCTSLAYRDAEGRSYLGRTLELDVEEPYLLAYVPAGAAFASAVEGHEAFEYTSSLPFLAVVAPMRLPTDDEPLTVEDLKVSEGLNAAGVTFSLLAYPTAGGGESAAEMTRAILQASDLGSWVLGLFSSAADIKAALAEQPVFLTRLAVVGDAEFPFHVVVHDRSGDCIVIEWHRGELTVHDNPVGVMTNGPEFPWHLTNLRNWTHLSNVDRSTATFGDLTVSQPDSGIATAALPGSNTSVGRFVRAAYYSTFTEKVADPDLAVATLARIMDTFDRPRGATIDPPEGGGGEGVSFQGVGERVGPPTEYTSWTNLSDLDRGAFLLRTYRSLGYTRFDLAALEGIGEPVGVLLSDLDPLGGEGSDLLVSAARGSAGDPGA